VLGPFSQYSGVRNKSSQLCLSCAEYPSQISDEFCKWKAAHFRKGRRSLVPIQFSFHAL
jgi:hypothetical protein